MVVRSDPTGEKGGLMQTTLRPGLAGAGRLKIVDGLTVPSVHHALSAFADMPRVFATAYLVAFVEATCIEAIAPVLPAGQHSVGTHVDLSHVAATPIGMTVSAEVELIEVAGRRLRFRVTCHDDTDLICRGHHERHVIDLAKFNDRVITKAAASGNDESS
ncbi:thioesterase family protein [Micromonospora sp. Llam7]|uniref:thioesterase family protein n=1 Tax=Micromonospora tarapacensis TaxID=2835305 RepID=UPI001C837E8B|nr:thioesterase family protein [Micromonospora tarapacensis]MBX7265785.1 thioesterase family protein [Micromonospora tarapacensis]